MFKQSKIFISSFLCFVIFGMNIFSSLQKKRVEQSNPPIAEQPSKKKVKLNNGQMTRVAASVLVPNSFPNYMEPIKNFPHDVWKIITSYVTLSDLIRHPFILPDSKKKIAIDVRTQGKIVQTALSKNGVVALRTTRGSVQIYNPDGQIILEFRVPYSPACILELSEDETMVHVSSPEQVWDLKSGKQLQGIDFAAHKSESEMMHITSQSAELVLSNERLVRLRNLPKSHKAALELGEGKDRIIVIPFKNAPEGKKRGIQVYDQRTGNLTFDLKGHCVRKDCFENGGPLITTSNNQDFIWNNERAIYRVPKKLTDTKLNKQGNILIATNELGSRIRIWDLKFLTTPLTVDQTIFLWAIDAYKTWDCRGSLMTLTDLVEFCDSQAVTIEEVERVYATFDPILKAVLTETYHINTHKE